MNLPVSLHGCPRIQSPLVQKLFSKTDDMRTPKTPSDGVRLQAAIRMHV